MNKPRVIRLLLSMGIASPILFWIATIICGAIHGDYNHITDTISELGALGSKSQYLFSVLILLMSVAGIGFVAGLYRACKNAGLSFAPVLTITVFYFGNIAIAFFPLGDSRHPVAGNITLLVMLGPILAMLLWQGSQFRTLRTISLAAFVIFMLALALILSGLLPDGFEQTHEGLLQRFFHAGWSFWFIGLSTQFKKTTTLT